MNEKTRIDELQYLLQERENFNNKVTNCLKDDNIKSETLKSDKAASLEDFIEMVSMLVNKTMQNLNVKFVPDEGARIRKDQKEILNNNYIFYDLISRKPIIEKKPRPREEFVENTNDENNKRIGFVFGQKFQTIIQFNILACDYKTANAVMNGLEDLLFKYTGFFKQNGISEILFKNQFTDQNLGYYRQNLSVRSLVYEVITERLYTQFKSNIQTVQIN